jgi:predicted RNase H-like HicB family nuclease
VKTLIREALQFHLEELRRDGETIPEPTSRIGYVKIEETDVVA